jgi:hypothetical protein
MINWKLTLMLGTILATNLGCMSSGNIAIKLKSGNKSTSKTLSAQVANVSIVNHQLIIDGSSLSGITSITLKNNSQNETFQVDTSSAGQLIANGVQNISILAGSVFDLILSSAEGAATYQVTFAIDNNSISTSKIVDGAVTAAKLSNMGASSGQYLKYNGSTWVPSSIIDGRTYIGTWDASTNNPDLTTLTPSAGDYYIISIAGTYSGITYGVGDWIISDGYNWQQIASSKTSVASFQGRKGIVVLEPADYVSLKNGLSKLTGSSLNDFADVDLSLIAPAAGQVLQYNGTKWIRGSVTITESDPLVSAFAKVGLPTCTAGQILTSADGTTLSCVNDSAGAFAGTAGRVAVTNGPGGTLGVSTVTDTELGYLSGATSNIQTQLGLKATSASIVDWSSSTVTAPFVHPTRIYGAAAQLNKVLVTDAMGAINGSTITTTQLGYLSAVTSDIQAQINAKQTTIANATSTEIGYLSGVTSAIQTQINSKQPTITTATILPVAATRLYGSNGVNYVELDVPSAIAANYSFILPASYGTVNQVLSTDGAGNLSWATSGGGLPAGVGSVSAPSYAFSGNTNTGMYRPAANQIAFANNGVQSVLIDASGNVGIGNTPSEKLEVTGNIKATAFLYSSDRRLKEDVQELGSPLKTVMKLHGVNFRWRENKTRDVGFIAQEVEAILPDVVHTSESTGLKSVKYGNLVALLVEAIKSMYQKFELKFHAHDTRVTNLEIENKNLKAAIDRQQAQIDQLMKMNAESTGVKK